MQTKTTVNKKDHQSCWFTRPRRFGSTISPSSTCKAPDIAFRTWGFTWSWTRVFAPRKKKDSLWYQFDWRGSTWLFIALGPEFNCGQQPWTNPRIAIFRGAGTSVKLLNLCRGIWFKTHEESVLDTALSIWKRQVWHCPHVDFICRGSVLSVLGSLFRFIIGDDKRPTERVPNMFPQYLSPSRLSIMVKSFRMIGTSIFFAINIRGHSFLHQLIRVCWIEKAITCYNHVSASQVFSLLGRNSAVAQFFLELVFSVQYYNVLYIIFCIIYCTIFLASFCYPFCGAAPCLRRRSLNANAMYLNSVLDSIGTENGSFTAEDIYRLNEAIFNLPEEDSPGPKRQKKSQKNIKLAKF